MELLRIIEEYLDAGGGRCALATVVDTVGPAYRRAGARQIIRQDGRTWGAITGGCVEADLILHAVEVMKSGEPKVVRYSAAEDETIFGLGTGCGGEIVVLLEPVEEAFVRELRGELVATRPGHDSLITIHRASDVRLLGTRISPGATAAAGALVQPVSRPLSLVLCGASPAASAMIRLAKELGWKVTVADHRPAVADDARFAEADEIVVAPVEELPARLSWMPPSAAVVMTHHYRRDFEWLKALLTHELAYLGLVGARGRAERMVADLRGAGFAKEQLARLRAPAGLDLGMDTPAEIALSIVAEIQAVLRGATATALRDRRGSIHDDAGRNSIVILAAGGSRRMGAPKQLLTIDGLSLIRRAAETALAVGGGPVYVVTGAESERVCGELRGLPIEVLVNRDWQEGMASSIRRAVEGVEASERPIETLTFMLCDQPGVTVAVLRRLLAAHRRTSAPVIASRYPDGPGVPALFRAEMFGALKSLRGDVGARQLIRKLDREVATIPFDAAEDIDTPSDFARYETRQPEPNKFAGREP